MEKLTVQTLDRLGLRPRWRHERLYVPLQPVLMTTGQFHRAEAVLPKTSFWLSPKGGATICELVDEKGLVVAAGIARVHPNDHFNKAIGRIKSLGRAVGELNREATERIVGIDPSASADTTAIRVH